MHNIGTNEKKFKKTQLFSRDLMKQPHDVENNSTFSLVVHAVDSPLAGLHFSQEQDGLVLRVEET
jgi:hypothetical protein